MTTRTNTDWILTYTGQKFYPLDPRPEDVDIRDIAHALSMTCRFNGHVKEFYSVAQHSVYVATLMRLWNGDNETCLAALLHDASEAYLNDIVKPVKTSAEFEFYRKAESRLQAVIAERFNLKPNARIIEADVQMLKAEAYHLMPEHPDWALTTELPEPPFDTYFRCWQPSEARRKFLMRYTALAEPVI